MTQLGLLKRFNHSHAAIIVNLENYVREHGGHVECNKAVHMRYLNSTDERSDTVYQFDHIYIDSHNECIVVYTEDTELGDIELKNLTCDELHDLILDICETNTKKRDDWSRYINYLHEWADYHAGSINSGMSPVSFDEWMDNEKELEDESEKD